MRPDIVNLRQFYSSRLGRRVKLHLRRVARRHWPMTTGGVTLGVGYAVPLERAMARARGESELVLVLMPAEQGGLYWPADGQNRSVIGDVMRPPFAPNSIARMVMMHVLEHASRPDELLRISWQMLAPGGRLLMVVPNRRGLWARLGHTPFATGTPYRLNELKTLLRDADFTLREVSSACYAPPSTHPFWLASWWLLEWLGAMFLPRSGGVFIIEAEKQIYAAVGNRAATPVAANAWQGVPV
jgi:hypothetical protein